MKKTSWIIIGILSTLVGLYPIIYFLIDRQFGLLSSKSADLLSNNLWNIAFYGHIVLGGIALLIGWLQFSKKLRRNRIKLHKSIGKIYVISVLISGICGLYIAFFATGGIISILGFYSLGIIWLSTTIISFIAIKNKNVALHEKLMIFSYAACFGAVTLRIWLPILINLIGGFTVAYRIVAWLSWVPNIIIAYLITKNKSKPNIIDLKKS
ncbi:DUF2306 domain-containing protein [Polaribacter gochangensis]|uniref:DUF2306 domain-containing protein n=1 Tax=Polaribacter gochangensis TaxID=3252903 RepID=UPI0039048A77